MAAEAAAPAPVAAAAGAAATAAPKRGAPSPAGGAASPVRPGLARGARGRGGADAGSGRPGPAWPGGTPRGGGRGGPSGAGPGRGRGRAGGGRSGGLGAGVPPTSARPAGSPTPRCTGGGRSSWTSVPRGVRWRGATPTPAPPRGAPRLEPPSQRCQSARKLRSCRPPAGITHPVGTCRCFRQAWAETPATTASPRTGPLGAPRPPRAAPAARPGAPAPPRLPRAGLPNISPGRAPHSCPSLSDVTLKVFIGVENSPHPHGFPRVLISGPGAPSILVACELERSWEGGVEEPRLGCA